MPSAPTLPTFAAYKISMKRTKIVDLLKAEPTGQEVLVQGWVRSRRGGKGLAFVALNDGSTIKTVQVVLDENFANNFEGDYDAFLNSINNNASIGVRGTWEPSAGREQAGDVIPQEVIVYGGFNEDYPIQKQKKGPSLDFLREKAHLRMRTNTFASVFRIRHALAYAVHKYYNDKGFFYVHTPIVTGADTEGAGEQFNVTTLDMKNPPLNEDGSIDYSQDFFGKSTHLTVSGQLNGELFAMALGEIYTFGPTFRAENSNTSRHLAEFWMIEPEMAFYDNNDNQDLAEDFMKYLVRYVLDHCADDLAFLDERIKKEEQGLPKEKRRDMGLIETLNFVIENDFERITYTDAVNILRNSKPYKKGRFEYEVEWGKDLQSEHERYLVEKKFKKPVIVTDYPKGIKAFYMKQNEDGETVRAMDVLFPGIGEIIGGSQREENLDVLSARMAELEMEEEDYGWYLDTRRFGTAPHSGFGLGFERMMMFVTGMNNIRDVIPFPRAPKTAEF